MSASEPPADPWRDRPAPQYGAPQYGAPQYGAPQYGAPAPGGPSNGLGTAALVLGIVGLVLAVFLIGAIPGVLAVIFGALGRARVRRGRATNRGTATAGIVLGILSLAVAAAMVYLVVVALGPDVRTYLRCLNAAAGDPVATQACQTQLDRSITGRPGG